jgi:hypothetical protein
MSFVEASRLIAERAERLGSFVGIRVCEKLYSTGVRLDRMGSDAFNRIFSTAHTDPSAGSLIKRKSVAALIEIARSRI